MVIIFLTDECLFVCSVCLNQPRIAPRYLGSTYEYGEMSGAILHSCLGAPNLKIVRVMFEACAAADCCLPTMHVSVPFRDSLTISNVLALLEFCK